MQSFIWCVSMPTHRFSRTPRCKGRRRSWQGTHKNPKQPAQRLSREKKGHLGMTIVALLCGAYGSGFCAAHNSGTARKDLWPSSLLFSILFVSGLSTHSPIDVSALGFQASSAWTSLALVLSLEGSHKPNSLELGWFGLSAPLSLSPQDTILYGTRKLFVGHNFGGFIISFGVKQKHSLSSCRAFSQPCSLCLCHVSSVNACDTLDFLYSKCVP